MNIALLVNVLTQIMNDLPEFWEVGKETVESVAAEFSGADNATKKKEATEAMQAWFKLAAKKTGLQTQQQTFFLEKMIPDLVEWIYKSEKANPENEVIQ